MDRKAIIILIASLAFIFGVWNPLINKYFPPTKVPVVQSTNDVATLNTNSLPQSTNSVSDVATTNAGVNTAFVSSTQLQQSATNTPTPILSLPAGSEEQQIVLENNLAKYTFTSLGGGISKIELKKYPADLKSKKEEDTNSIALLTLNEGVSVPIFTALGTDTNLIKQDYALTKVNDTTVQASIPLSDGTLLTKTFTISTNYTFKANLAISNLSTNPVQTAPIELVTGNATPINHNDRGDLMNVFWYNGNDLETIGESWFANRTLGCSVSQRRTLYTGGDGMTNVAWVACANRFFAIATVPVNGAAKVAVHEIPLNNVPENLGKKGIHQGFQASILYPTTILKPSDVISYDYDIYAGPKEYKTLAKLGISNNLDLIMGFSGFFGFFSKLLLLGMNWVNSLLHVGYGLAIIIITIIIKLIFWPLTTASTRSMKRMSALQPEMAAIREKYKDDQKKMNEKLMTFMRENKVNPMGGCLPILIQIPVFIGFYKMLMSAIELRGASFLWAADLSVPDTIFTLPGLGIPINPLPLIMGASMLWQSSMTPPSPGMDPVQQKMFRFMPLIFIFFCYGLPSGLSLYWTVQNIVSVIQMKVTRAHDPAAATANAAPVRPLNKPLSLGSLHSKTPKQKNK